jgi:hypothetical protein
VATKSSNRSPRLKDLVEIVFVAAEIVFVAAEIVLVAAEIVSSALFRVREAQNQTQNQTQTQTLNQAMKIQIFVPGPPLLVAVYLFEVYTYR